MKVFSFCLYGDRDKYCLGILENLKIIQETFPSWVTFVYYASDVPELILTRIQEFPRVFLKPTGVHGPINMIHRFFAIDEDAVDIMIVRDADSRIHTRDQWTINEWLQSEKKAHIVRDHQFHNAYIMGGVWGLKKGLLAQTVTGLFEAYRSQHRNQHWEDQHFLARVVYPLIHQDALFHGCIRMHHSENIILIPFPLQDGEFIGQVVEYQNGIPVPTME
jgi:hypothetical protein